MEPSYSEGDYLLVNHFAFYFRKPRKGEVVLLKDPRTGKSILKRIHTIRGEKYDVRGDNPSQSTDSQHFGWVREEQILGKVLFHVPS